MEFRQPKGIYQQIADQVSERIAGGEWAAGDRIPSVREMAVTLGVNPNTVTRSYQRLLENEIIENRRGIGYFVAPMARDRIMDEMRAKFIGEDLPRMFKMMKKLDMGVGELISLYDSYIKEGEEVVENE